MFSKEYAHILRLLRISLGLKIVISCFSSFWWDEHANESFYQLILQLGNFGTNKNVRRKMKRSAKNTHYVRCEYKHERHLKNSSKNEITLNDHKAN